MSKETPLKSLINHLAAASSTLVGALGALFLASKFFGVDTYFLRLGIYGEVILAILVAVFASFVTAFVNRSIVEKTGDEKKKIDDKP